ncbi:hypothetical protein H7347_04620 [Corynebacterium sp. zg-331]|uniref:hypothetical protein n=1 Tax=unclassified Corynebacterium TaxID=2624378 RepID=UPI00128E6ACA|nr:MULTISPECIES: hypothetical protein [unclassified Corynebacterium]MBC3185861.1 hypothetical protein [Corynebacterium sp. zg-331]MPV52352.1 hypothetical protein [Corynebacterium sp. zg331]
MKISRTSIVAALASAALALGPALAPAHAAEEAGTPHPTAGSPADDVLRFIERLVPLTSHAVVFF